MLDLCIRRGLLVDGTGTPGVIADIGVRAGRIVAIGTVDEQARQEIVADGLVVAPGFIDIHTHYDAQAFWDPTLSPSGLHGITTVVGGNCGFSIAPLSDESGDYLMPMLARVEGMPLDSLRRGVPWDWRTTGDYLGRLEGRLYANAGFMVGHSALRRFVMGEHANEREATDDELVAMQDLLRAGLAVGGLGFSTSRGSAHNDGDGRPVPSRFASFDEFVALAAVCAEFEGTSLECVPGADWEEGTRVMVAMSAAARRPLNWNVLTPDASNLEDSRRRLEAGTAARAAGGDVIALTMPVSVPARLSFLSGVVLDALPDWKETMHLEPAAKLHALRDPAVRDHLRRSAEMPSHLSRFANWRAAQVFEAFTPENQRFVGRTLEDIARELGSEPFDALCDIACADGLQTRFGQVMHETAADWEARLEIWRDDRAILGGSDAGAHLDLAGSFDYCTRFLGTAVRELQLLPLEEAIAMITSAPADLYGLRDRGRLTEGSCADIVIFDPGAVGSQPMATRFDLPGGAGRLYAESVGVHHVFVNGNEVVRDGAYTEVPGGAVLRSGTDTFTPALH